MAKSRMLGDNFDNGMIGKPYEDMITFIGKTEILVHESAKESKASENFSLVQKNPNNPHDKSVIIGC